METSSNPFVISKKYVFEPDETNIYKFIPSGWHKNLNMSQLQRLIMGKTVKTIEENTFELFPNEILEKIFSCNESESVRLIIVKSRHEFVSTVFIGVKNLRRILPFVCGHRPSDGSESWCKNRAPHKIYVGVINGDKVVYKDVYGDDPILKSGSTAFVWHHDTIPSFFDWSSLISRIKDDDVKMKENQRMKMRQL